MTRWLEAARRESGSGKKPYLPKKPSDPEVNSVKSVFPNGRLPNLGEPIGFPEELSRRFFAAQAAAMADTDVVARTPEAIEAVWDWALAIAREKSR